MKLRSSHSLLRPLITESKNHSDTEDEARFAKPPRAWRLGPRIRSTHEPLFTPEDDSFLRGKGSILEFGIRERPYARYNRSG